MKNFLLLITLLFCTLSLSAQTPYAKWGLGVYPSGLSFYALENNALLERSEYEPGVRFTIARYLNASFDLGVEGTLAIVRHPAGEENNANNRLWRDNFYDGDIFLKYKLYNGYLLGQKAFIAPYLKAGIGPNSYAGDTLGIFAPLGVGLGIRLNSSAYLTAESMYKAGVANSENYLHHSVGLNINLGTAGRDLKLRRAKIRDKDGDGLSDMVDRCPDIKGDPKTGGCPDADNDGVLDDVDKCPDTKGYANLGGCQDKDNDGLSDIDDKCPDSFGPKDNNGCPAEGSVPTATDTDGDNIPDEMDKCPNVKGLFTAGGCPDADADGIEDSKDACPDFYGKVAFNGCPYDAVGMERLRKGYDPTKEPSLVVSAPKPEKSSDGMSLSVSSVGRDEFVTTDFDYCAYFDEFRNEFSEGINFGTGSANINASTRKVLNRLAKFTKKCGQRSVIINGHTDDTGTPEANQKLSERRAEAVKKYLVKKGVDANLLQAVGYGATQPVAPNDTAENKAKNRRVELLIQ